jgi:hypothetical protein
MRGRDPSMGFDFKLGHCQGQRLPESSRFNLGEFHPSSHNRHLVNQAYGRFVGVEMGVSQVRSEKATDICSEFQDGVTAISYLFETRVIQITDR